jgi:hypothetical protein
LRRSPSDGAQRQGVDDPFLFRLDGFAVDTESRYSTFTVDAEPRHLARFSKERHTMSERTIAQDIFISFGKIVERSDVTIKFRRVNISSYPFMPKSWKKLPEDMFAFYEKVNGFRYIWTFNDTNDNSGLGLVALVGSGKTIDLLQRRSSLSFIDVGQFGIPLDSSAGPINPKWKMLLFEGSEDASGSVMFFDKKGSKGVYRYNNDGDVHKYAESFTEALRIGLPSGFSHMWGYPEHFLVQEVMKRLAEPIAPRKTYTLEIERCEEVGADHTRVYFTASCKKEQGEFSESGEVERILTSVDAFQSLRDYCGDDYEVYRYCPSFLYPSPLILEEGGYKTIDDHTFQRHILLPRDAAKDIKVGIYDAPALINVTSEVARREFESFR